METLIWVLKAIWNFMAVIGSLCTIVAILLIIHALTADIPVIDDSKHLNN